MRIGINSLFLIPGKVGGTESYLRNLIRIFQEVDHEDEFVIFTNKENAGSFQLQAPNFREVRCPVRAESRPQRILYEQLALPWQCRNLDVLHSGGYTAPLKLRPASVVGVHDLNYHYFPEDWSAAALWASRLLIPLAARAAARVLTLSHSSERAIVEVLGVPKERIDVVYLGVDGNFPTTGAAEEAEVRARYRLDGRFLLSVTASHPHKNLDGLLKAYQLACRDWPSPPPLVIVGIKGRHQEQIEATLAAESGPGRVVLTGWIEATQLAALYRAAHLFVFPSKYEGFGFPPLEAMAAGLPVVSSRAASLAEVVGDGGLLFDPENEAEMAAAIRRAWDDEVLRKDLIVRGRERAAGFTWRKTAEQTLASYRRARSSV